MKRSGPAALSPLLLHSRWPLILYLTLLSLSFCFFDLCPCDIMSIIVQLLLSDMHV